jgi:hypothetical protein
MKTKGRDKRRVLETDRAEEERRDETGTLATDLGNSISHALLFVKCKIKVLD